MTVLFCEVCMYALHRNRMLWSSHHRVHHTTTLLPLHILSLLFPQTPSPVWSSRLEALHSGRPLHHSTIKKSLPLFPSNRFASGWSSEECNIQAFHVEESRANAGAFRVRPHMEQRGWCRQHNGGGRAQELVEAASTGSKAGITLRGGGNRGTLK